MLISMITVESASQFFQRMRLFISVVLQIVKETNVQDCVIVEIHIIRLKNRETFIS